MFADRGETPCLFPIQRCRPAGAHPSERYDDAKLVASGLPMAVRKTATALRKDTVSLRGRRKWWSLFGLGILCVLSSSESIRIRIPVSACTCLFVTFRVKRARSSRRSGNSHFACTVNIVALILRPPNTSNHNICNLPSMMPFYPISF
jgi:hypothetical protein